MICLARLFRTISLLLSGLAAASLPACSKQPISASTDGQMTAQISPYNHTADYIHQFYVNEAGGGNAFAFSGGGSFVCCIAYPRKWTPGLTAKLRWTTSPSDPEAAGDAAVEKWHEALVPIERYSEPGTTLNVHFLPGGKVRLLISNLSAGNPRYQGPAAPVKPDDFKHQRN